LSFGLSFPVSYDMSGDRPDVSFDWKHPTLDIRWGGAVHITPLIAPFGLSGFATGGKHFPLWTRDRDEDE
jgi:hypothetical protein